MGMNVSVNKKKIAIIMICATAVVIAAVCAAASFFFRTGTIKKAIDLGSRYLAELDYDSAIQAYSSALSVDSLNKDALFGLAQCYDGKGDSQMARQIMEDTLKTYSDADLKRYLADLYIKDEDYQEAVRLITEVIEDTDDDGDYEQREEVLTKIFERGHSYAAGEYVTLSIRDGNVVSRGSNVLGALGTAAGLGLAGDRREFGDAGFSGNASKVYAMETSSAVIDESGSLWLAGSNRSGQQSVGSSTLIPTAGWKKMDGMIGAAIAGGTESTVFVVNRQGTLYVAGENKHYAPGEEWLPQFTPVYALGTVIDMQASMGGAAVLNARGDLYTVDSTNRDSQSISSGLSWSKLASGVKSFSYDGGSLVWIDSSGRIMLDYAYLEIPNDWSATDEYGNSIVQPTGDIKEAAVTEEALLLLAQDGSLQLVREGKILAVNPAKEVSHIYSSGYEFVVESMDGSYKVYSRQGDKVTD